MNTRLIFLRHAETQKDPGLPARDWTLSDAGSREANLITKIPTMLKVQAIFASDEEKARLTAIPLAQELSLPINQDSAFSEVHRGDVFFDKEAFEVEKEKQFRDLSYHAFGGESGLEALERFQHGIAAVTQQYPNCTILIVSHGTILNIYFSHLLNALDQLPERWGRTPFCAYGIVENNTVIKDIAL
jgi:broad specificity phosphatase PhoE